MLGRLARRSGAPALVQQVPRPAALDLGAYPGIDALLDSGDVLGALALIRDREPGFDELRLARVELQLRNEAFERVRRSPAPDVEWPPVSDKDLGPQGQLPEITADALDRETLIAGVRTYGILIVRGLFPTDACADLRAMIDNSVDTFSRDRNQEDPAWNMPLRTVDGDVLGAAAFRAFNHAAGGLAVGDAPAVSQRVLAAFEQVGIRDIVQSYLGERPAVSLEKWTMRKVPADTGSSWHQDGAFLGTDKHTLNMWVALSDCGERASGLDIVAKRFDHIVATGTAGSFLYWDVSPAVVEQERGDHPIASPVFQEGDAVFFDQFLLHKTGTKPNLTEDRYALETWFFSPHTFLGKYSGLLL